MPEPRAGESRDKADLTVDDLDEGGGKLPPQQGPRCPPGQHWDRVEQACVPDTPVARHDLDCGCCGTGNAEFTLVQLQMALLGVTMQRVQDESERQGLQPLGNRQEPGHDDPFLEDELVIATALAGAAFDKADKVLDIYDPVLSGDTLDEDELADAAERANEEWQDTFDAADAVVTGAIAAAVTTGESRVSPGIIGDAPSRRMIMDGMRTVARYNTNNFFNTQVLPALQRKVLETLGNTGATDAPDLSAIRQVLDRRLKTVPYWRTVANASASRSYHWGLLKAAQFQGRQGYKFVAILDDRTSQICRNLSGREWFIADAVNLMERAAADPDPESIKTYMPWVSAGAVEGLSNDALRDMGVMVPPLHGNCRSTIVPI